MLDEAARVAGLQSGEYHYLEEIIPDQIEVLGDNPDVNIQILPPRSYGVIILNTVAGLMSNVQIRQAVQAAIAVVPSGQATHGDGYFEPGPGIMLPQTAWHSEVSAELYDQGDPEKAKQLLTEAGYDGTPIRLLATQEDLGDYNAAVVAQQHLEEAGFTVELEVTDEATLDENLENDGRWDMTTNAYVFRPDPVLIAAFASCTADRQWCSDAKLAAMERLQTESAPDARFAAFEEFQRLWYAEAPAIKLVNNYGVAALSSRVKNLIETTHFEIEPEFANCWLEESYVSIEGSGALAAPLPPMPRTTRRPRVIADIVRRLLLLIPVLLIVGIVVFSLLHLAPGDPASMMLGREATQEQKDALREQLGLNEPVPVQFVEWFWGVLRLDLGDSLFIGKPVTEALLERFQPTGLLAQYSLVVAVIIAVPSGVLAALRPNSLLDRLLMIMSISGAAIPGLFFGILLILFFAVVLDWVPSGGYEDLSVDPVQHFRYMVLPTVALGFSGAGFLVVQGAVMVIAAVEVIIMLIVDILYVFIDPRIRHGAR